MTPAGAYEGCLLVGVESPHGDRVPIEHVALRVKGRRHIPNSISGSRIYFHFGIDPSR